MEKNEYMLRLAGLINEEDLPPSVSSVPSHGLGPVYGKKTRGPIGEEDRATIEKLEQKMTDLGFSMAELEDKELAQAFLDSFHEMWAGVKKRLTDLNYPEADYVFSK